MSTAVAFRGFLNQAHDALTGDKAQDAERLAKAISALVRAERDVAEFLTALQAVNEQDDEDAIRAELQRRFALFAAASRSGHSADALARIAAAGVDP